MLDDSLMFVSCVVDIWRFCGRILMVLVMKALMRACLSMQNGEEQ